MLPQRLVFVDIETTGLSVIRDRIIEIGILRVEENRLVHTYQTLINPEMYISPHIEAITGISKKDLENAPTFSDIQRTLRELFENAVFVAHNVRFDYGFLKNEFRRYGATFSSKHFCTAKLSRKLFPHHRHHNLDSIIERFQLQCKRRHRAFDDAKVLWDFFQKLQTQISPDILEQALAFGLKKPSLPLGLSLQSVERLPESPGVYIFYGEKDVPLYVGKSKNIKDRVLSHFTNDHTASKEMHMCQQVKRIETIVTSGELGALIKESSLIKQMQPIYNRVLRISRKLILLKKSHNKHGYHVVTMHTVDTIDYSDIEDIIGIYRSKKQAKNFLIAQTKKYALCEKLLGVEKTTDACFGYRLNACRGACVKAERSVSYNMRFVEAFTHYKIKSWPFGGPIAIKEKNELDNREESIIIDKWCLIGNINMQEDAYVKTEERKPFDLDIYKILVRFLHEPKNQNNIMKIRSDQMQRLFS
jgi:DNA polymerase-3 subunit epsilon